MNFAICLVLATVLTLSGCSKNIEPYKPAIFSKELLRKAEEGDPKAQLQLAGAYQEARGVRKDEGMALEWMQKSANQGYPLALLALGAKYLEGDGVNRDQEKARKLFQDAADKGSAGGQYNIGCIYYNGLGVPKNDEKAFYWVKKAAEQNNPEEINLMKPKPGFILGQLYERGEGCKKSLKTALKWYKKTASLGDEQAGNMVLILQPQDKTIIEKFKRIFKQKTEIDGLIFVQFGLVGLASYHFDLIKRSYINYENRPTEWKFDDGSPIADKVYFSNEKYDSKTKTFDANVVFEKEFLGIKLAKFHFKFDDSLARIISGNIQTLNSKGSPIEVKSLLVKYGTDITKELVYKRHVQSSTNPQ
jgi:hypothetical protein